MLNKHPCLDPPRDSRDLSAGFKFLAAPPGPHKEALGPSKLTERTQRFPAAHIWLNAPPLSYRDDKPGAFFFSLLAWEYGGGGGGVF